MRRFSKYVMTGILNIILSNPKGIANTEFWGLDFYSTFQEWMHQVGIFDEVLKGFIIGIIISAPMGPVGILTVQRTLNKGRKEGLATGIGASASDFLYAIVTGYGMSFVIDIIENPAIALVIKIVGSILLFGFGLYTFRSMPSNTKISDNIPTPHEANDIRSYVISGFAVTVSNPLIIFMLLALFGQFTFIISDNIIPQIMGYLAIIGGALFWWFSLTWLIDKVRTRFTSKVLWWINRIIGIVVMVVSAIMIVYTVTGHAIPFKSN